MGAGALTRPSFEGKEKFQSWSVQNVEDALQRLRDSDAGKAAPTAIDRSLFFTVFNDYTVFTDDGFLSLPLDLFAWLDTRGAQRVHVGKPFLLLCLLCDGDLEARMRVLFRVFDFNLDGKLDRESAGTMMGVLVEVLQLIGVLPNKGGEAAEAVASTPMSPRFHDDDLLHAFFGDDDELAEAKFVAAWNTKGAHILGGLNRVATESSPSGDAAAKKRKPRKKGGGLDPTKSAARHERAKERYGAEAAQKKRAADIAAKAEAHMAATGLEMDAHTRRNHFREEHGRLSQVASQKALTELMSATSLAYPDLSALRVEFSDAVNRKGVDGSMAISIGRLKSVLIAKFPSLSDGKILERVCSVFDVNEDGKVDFEEFALSVAKLVRSDGGEGQIDFLFSMYDKDGNGTVELWEMCDIIESAQDDANELLAYAEGKTVSLDTNGDGAISTGEFTAALASDATYRNFLWSGVTTIPPQHVAKLAGLSTDAWLGEGAFAVGPLLRLWENLMLNTRATESNELAFDPFFHSVENVYGAERCARGAVKDDLRAIFEYYRGIAPEKGDKLDAGLLWGAFAKFCAGADPAVQSQVVCALVNADKTEAVDVIDDVISRDELTAWLTKIKHTADSLSSNTVLMLDKLDESGDGKIDCAEMKKLIFEEPVLMQCLGALQLYGA